jgi:hypothetical protein
MVMNNMTAQQKASATARGGVVAAGELHVEGQHTPEQFVECSGGAGAGAPDAVHVLRGDEVPLRDQLIREVIPSVPEAQLTHGVDEAFPTAHDRHGSRRQQYLDDNRAAPAHPGPRSHDAEKKILDSASAQLAQMPRPAGAKKPTAAGELHLMPSHPPCPACTAAIHAFKGDHPNVKVFLYDFKPRAPETPAKLDGFFDDLYD